MNLDSNINSTNENNENNENNFAIDLYKALFEQYNIEANVIISPFLLEALLSLIYLGSDGTTADELKDILRLKRFKTNAAMANYYAENFALITQTQEQRQIDATQLLVDICSELWLKELSTVNVEFKRIASKYFHTDIKELHSNNDKVHLKHSLNIDLTQLWLLSSINYQYKWFLPFSPYRTGLSDFYMLNKLTKPTAMMHDNEMFIRYIEMENFDVKIIELPYEHDDELVMLIMLPNKRDGLYDLMNQLKHINIHKISEAMHMEKVDILLPKFSIDFVCALKPALEKLGLKTLFNRDINLKNLFNATHACAGFSNYHHKVFIEVNETGTSMTNKTVLKPLNLHPTTNLQQKVFHADHPFYFVIKTSNVLVLMGHVLKL